jgi:uncharacterized membrane protein YfcA
MLEMFTAMSFENFIFVLVMCFIASAVDAIAGGGGLISLPAMISTGLPIHLVMGTHKFSSVCSSIGSSLKFFTSGKTNLEVLKYLIGLNICGAAFGVFILTKINDAFLEPLIIVLLVFMFFYMLFNKGIGVEDNYNGKTKKNMMQGALMATLIGFYNGFFGPGTGSFLTFAFIKIYGMDFINSSGNSKILNLTGNVASLAMFIYFKKVNYPYAIAIGIVMFLGAQIGAKIAIAKGAKFIKPFFLVVTAITAAKMIITKFM